MQKIHFSINIHAPKEKVWNTMLEDSTYREWTTAFQAGSFYEGSWDQGSEIRFLGPDENGKLGGMFSKIKENRLHEFVSIEHVGFIKDGVIDTTSEEVKKWTPSYENYTFTETDSVTVVSVDIDVNDEYKEMFEVMWPKALQLLKTLAEK
jgi:uncharacterized protein YndB with AHSA1/START domain